MLVVLLVFNPDHGIKPHYITRARSTTVSFLGRLPSSLPVLVAFTFVKNRNFCTCQSRGTVRMTVERISWSITTKVTSAVRESNPGRPIHSSTLYILSLLDGWGCNNILLKQFPNIKECVKMYSKCLFTHNFNIIVKGIGMDGLMSVLYKYSSFKKRYHDSFSVDINPISEKFVF
jgi:hypothetical protein